MQEFIFSQSWRLEVQGQGARGFVFNLRVSPWLADGHLLAVCSHGHLSACMYLVFLPLSLSLCSNLFL